MPSLVRLGSGLVDLAVLWDEWGSPPPPSPSPSPPLAAENVRSLRPVPVPALESHEIDAFKMEVRNSLVSQIKRQRRSQERRFWYQLGEIRTTIKSWFYPRPVLEEPPTRKRS